MADPPAAVRPAVSSIDGAALRRAWVARLGLLAGVLLWTIAWYWDATKSMAAIWWRSDTFAHGLVVYPIAVWLVWRERARLAGIDCRFSALGAAAVALAGCAWLLGELGRVDAARHFGVVLIVASCVWAVLGTALVRAIAFPLTFTLLAVPVGEFMLPMLIEHTADFTVGALRLTGIPVYREGNNFVVPSGHWSVVEACSGLRYLIASVTLGLLYAYLSYRSLTRRMLFVAASIVVPIIANWLRAYMIVMIGHLSDMKYAVGVDHLLYGWLFFGIVMLMLFWIGSRWREDHLESSASPAIAKDAGAGGRPTHLLLAAVITCAIASAAPLYAHYLDTRLEQGAFSLALPETANGWERTEGRPLATYRPHYLGARAEVESGYVKDGRRLMLFVAYYANEGSGRELIAHGNAIVDPGSHVWDTLRRRAVPQGAGNIEATESNLRSGSFELIARHWYWVGGTWVRRPEEVKIRQAIGRLLGRGDDAAVVVVYAPVGSSSSDMSGVIDGFVADMAPSIETALRRARSSTTIDGAAGSHR